MPFNMTDATKIRQKHFVSIFLGSMRMRVNCNICHVSSKYKLFRYYVVFLLYVRHSFLKGLTASEVDSKSAARHNGCTHCGQRHNVTLNTIIRSCFVNDVPRAPKGPFKCYVTLIFWKIDTHP